MRQERQGLQSTKSTDHDAYYKKIKTKIAQLRKNNPIIPLKDALTKDLINDLFPPSTTPNKKTNNMIFFPLRNIVRI